MPDASLANLNCAKLPAAIRLYNTETLSNDPLKIDKLAGHGLMMYVKIGSFITHFHLLMLFTIISRKGKTQSTPVCYRFTRHLVILVKSTFLPDYSVCF